MFVSRFSIIWIAILLIDANFATASVIINGSKFTDKAETPAKKVVPAKSISEKGQQHKRPRFKVVEPPALEYIASIKKKKQKLPVHKSVVQADGNEDIAYDESEWPEYKDDGDDYDDNGIKYEIAPTQNNSTSGKASKKLEHNKMKQTHSKMETLRIEHQKSTGHNDVAVGSPHMELTPTSANGITEPTPTVSASKIYLPAPTFYQTYSSGSCGEVIMLSYQPNYYGCASPAYNYPYCNACYSSWNLVN